MIPIAWMYQTKYGNRMLSFKREVAMRELGDYQYETALVAAPFHMQDEVCPHCGEFSNRAKDMRIRELQAALVMAVRQNSADMIMTGDEIRKCEKALLVGATYE